MIVTSSAARHAADCRAADATTTHARWCWWPARAAAAPACSPASSSGSATPSPQPEVPADDDEPARLRRVAVGGRLPHPPAAGAPACRSPTRARRVGARPRATGSTPRSRPSCASWLAAEFAQSRPRDRQGPAAVVVPPAVAPLRRGARRRAAARHDAAPPGGGDRLQAALVRRLAGRGRARRGLAQPDAVHRARHARDAARGGPLRRPARGLDARGRRAPARRSTSSVVRDAPRRRRCGEVHEFVDRGLSRSRPDWERRRAARRAARARPTRRGG